MRRTLSVVAMTAALLVPTTAALAVSTSNASCNSGAQVAGGTYNNNGQARGTCVGGSSTDSGAGTVGGPGSGT